MCIEHHAHTELTHVAGNPDSSRVFLHHCVGAETLLFHHITEVHATFFCRECVEASNDQMRAIHAWMQRLLRHYAAATASEKAAETTEVNHPAARLLILSCCVLRSDDLKLVN